MASFAPSLESLSLMKEYTKLKRLIDHHKRQEIIHCKKSPQGYRFTSNGTYKRHAPYQLTHWPRQKTNISQTSEIHSKRQFNFKKSTSHTVSKKTTTVFSKVNENQTATIASPFAKRAKCITSKYKLETENIANRTQKFVSSKAPSDSCLSKYSWHRGLQASSYASSLSRHTISAASTSKSSVITRNLKMPVALLTTTCNGSASMNSKAKPSRRKMRQVKKYSVKYVPMSQFNKCSSKILARIVNRRSSVINRKYCVDLRKQRLVLHKMQSQYVKIGNLLYKSTKTKLSRTGSAKMLKPIGRQTHLSLKQGLEKRVVAVAGSSRRLSKPYKEQIISVRGVRFAMDKQQKTLRRLPPSPLQQKVSKEHGSLLSRVDIGGETYVQKGPELLVKSSTRQLRSLASRVINKSIYNLTFKKQKSQQYCLFYNKFGRCSKQENGLCPYVHDKEKVAICKRFLRGLCQVEQCTFSHKLCRLKMPVCSFFLRGCCSHTSCPYRHVSVNPDAELCPDFAKGYCPRGEKCKKWHISHKQETKKGTGLQDSDRKIKNDSDVSKVGCRSLIKDRFPPVLKETEPVNGTLPSFISLAEFDDPVFEKHDLMPEPCLQIKPHFLNG